MDIAAVIAAARADGDAALSEPESKALLQEIGIPVPAGHVVTSTAAIPELAQTLDYPVVVKAVSRTLTHKTDVGGIVFPIATAADAVAACDLITERVRRARPDVVLDGFLVEAFQPAKFEFILSLRIDPQFGPLVMFGLGGIFVELLGQVSFRLAHSANLISTVYLRTIWWRACSLAFGVSHRWIATVSKVRSERCPPSAHTVRSPRAFPRSKSTL